MYTDINVIKVFLPKVENCSSSPQLTLEQLKQIEQKRNEALRRLAARNNPMSIGKSWYKHIGTEFSKPYFIKVNYNLHSTGTSHSKPWANLLLSNSAKDVVVSCFKLMSFVAEERKHFTVYPSKEQVFCWTNVCAFDAVSFLN